MSKYEPGLSIVLIFNILLQDRVVIDWASALLGYLSSVYFVISENTKNSHIYTSVNLLKCILDIDS